MPGIVCTGCASGDMYTYDTRYDKSHSYIRRRRKCKKCGARITTYEILEERLNAILEVYNRVTEEGQK